MEQQNPNDIPLSHFYCEKNNPARMVCGRQSCFNCALVCGNQQCNCRLKKHQKCDQFAFLDSLAKKVQKKKIPLSNNANNQFYAIETIYDQAINDLIQEKLKFEKWKKNYGLNEDQSKFLDAIIENNKNQLVGNLIFKVRYRLNLPLSLDKKKESQDKKLVQQFLSKEIPKFEKFKIELNKLYLSYTKYSLKYPLRFDFSTQASKNYKFDSKTKIIKKINGNKSYHCLVGLKPLSKQNKISFQITISKTQYGNIGIGIVTETGRTIQRKASSFKQAILYMANNGQFWNDGIGTQLGFQINEGQRVKVQVSRINKQIGWYANDNLLGSTQLDEIFLNENIYAIIEIGNKGDSIQIRD